MQIGVRTRMLLLQIALGSATATGVSLPCRAQTDSPVSISDSQGDSEPMQAESNSAPSDATTGAAEEQEDSPVDLETGLPRSVLLTPLRWGRLSLLSVSAYQGFNSNPDFQKIAVGTWLTSISALTMYSARFAGWNLDMQYRPFLWISSHRTFKDFAAAAVDLRKLSRINGNWNWTATEHLQYSPTHGTEEQRGFVFDPARGISIGNAFLSSGRNLLTNGAALTVTDRYSEAASWLFHANQDFVHLSGFV